MTAPVVDMADFIRRFYIARESYVIRLDSRHVLYLMHRSQTSPGICRDVDQVLEGLTDSVRDDVNHLYSLESERGEGMVEIKISPVVAQTEGSFWMNFGLFPHDSPGLIATRFTATLRNWLEDNGDLQFAELFFGIRLRINKKIENKEN